jgi:hypothetical protein
MKPSPQKPLNQTVKRLQKRNRMTLALAMVCDGGLMLAADTRLSYGDGTITTEATKLTGFASVGGMYAIAHSSEDANAANSLIGEIRLGLQNNNPKTFQVFEATVSSVLRTSYQPFHDNRPTIRLLIGACIEQEQDRGLYLCEPPNTVSRVYEHYKAVGDGWQVSDPIYKWFEDRAPWPPHACLCQISYMMYRAKKLFPGSVGGHTDVAFLTDPNSAPYWIKPLSMMTAEAYGINLDRYLSSITSAIMGQNCGDLDEILKTSEAAEMCNQLYSHLRFHTQIERYIIAQ